MHLFTTWRYFIFESSVLAAAALSSAQRCQTGGVCVLSGCNDMDQLMGRCITDKPILQAASTKPHSMGSFAHAPGLHCGQRCSPAMDSAAEHTAHQCTPCLSCLLRGDDLLLLWLHCSSMHLQTCGLHCVCMYSDGWSASVEPDPSRMQNGWCLGTLAGSWSMLLNFVNLTDACLHGLYAVSALRQVSSLWAALGKIWALLCTQARDAPNASTCPMCVACDSHGHDDSCVKLQVKPMHELQCAHRHWPLAPYHYCVACVPDLVQAPDLVFTQAL